MKVNAELKKDLQRNFEITTSGGGRRKSTYFAPMPSDVCRAELQAVLSGEQDIPRRVIRAIAKITNRPVSAYLGEQE